MPEDISIVMAVYNHERTLVDAIESALMQEMPYTSKIYCLDDASTDCSGDILSYYSSCYPDKIVVFTSEKNLGSGKASFYHHRPPVNGRYWCLLAGDDYWIRSDKLHKQIDFLDKNPGYAGASCNTLVKNERDGIESLIQPSRNEFNLLDLVLLKHAYSFYVHTTSVVWRNIYLDKGFFLPPDFSKPYAYGDVMLMHMMLGRGGSFMNLPEVMSCYRVTGRGVWTKKSQEEQYSSNQSLNESLHKTISSKMRFHLALQPLRKRIKYFRSLIKGPLNE